MEKYNILCVFLMFTGYPTETEEDFAETLAMLSKYKSYANTVIHSLELGYLTSIQPGTPLYTTSKQDKNIIVSKDPLIWYNKNNPQLTFTTRMDRRKLIEHHATECGYTLAWDTHSQFQETEVVYKNNSNLIKLIEKQ